MLNRNTEFVIALVVFRFVTLAILPEDVFPTTDKPQPGEAVPMPTRLFKASIVKVFESKLSALATLARVKVEAAPAERFNAPAEVKAKVPEVTVDSVRLFEVDEMVDAPSPWIDSAPEVEVMFSAPDERVNPLLAVRSPVEVTASPELLGDKVVPVRFQYPSIPDVGGVEVRPPTAFVYTAEDVAKPDRVSPVNVGEAAEEIP